MNDHGLGVVPYAGREVGEGHKIQYRTCFYRGPLWRCFADRSRLTAGRHTANGLRWIGIVVGPQPLKGLCFRGTCVIARAIL